MSWVQIQEPFFDVLGELYSVAFLPVVLLLCCHAFLSIISIRLLYMLITLLQITKAASDGPKLTHLTAQRPKVRGRRPPRRYVTYHEEDKDVRIINLWLHIPILFALYGEWSKQ